MKMNANEIDDYRRSFQFLLPLPILLQQLEREEISRWRVWKEVLEAKMPRIVRRRVSSEKLHAVDAQTGGASPLVHVVQHQVPSQFHCQRISGAHSSLLRKISGVTHPCFEMLFKEFFRRVLSCKQTKILRSWNVIPEPTTTPPL